MKLYKVNSPVLVRSDPNPSAAIVNALDVDTEVQAVGVYNGWIKTVSGFYIFKTDDIEELKASRGIEKTRSERLYNISLYSTTNPSTRAESNKEQPNDNVDTGLDGKTIRIKSGETKSNVTDAQIPQIEDQKYWSENSNLQIVTVDTGNGSVIVRDPDLGTSFTLGIDQISIKNTTTDSSGQESTKWDDVKLNDKLISYYQSAAVKAEAEAQGNELLNYIQSIGNAADTAIKQMNVLNTNHIRSVFGMPYQFHPLTDNRIDGNNQFDVSKFGRLYSSKIVARMPMLILQAGTPNFLFDYSSDQKDKIKSALKSELNGHDVSDSDVETIFNNGGRYYTFKDMSVEYFTTVNSMCRSMASLLNLDQYVNGNITVSGYSAKPTSFNWQTASQQTASAFSFYRGAVPFYINSDAQIQESFSSGTRQSQLASKVNQIGDLAAEINFLMGGITKNTGIDVKPDTDGVVKKDGSRNTMGLIGSIMDNVETVMAGGRMYFPEIWSDSSFMRSYDVTIKLDTPDCDKLSIWLNILVPLAHILAFVMPRSGGENTYISPYIVRAYYKSMFHIDSGIITSCSIQKGEQGAWTQDGLPTQITVQLTIKDLYDVLSMSVGSTKTGSTNIISNPGQLDYIANLCGINISEPNFYRFVKLWLITRYGQNTIPDAVNNLYTTLMGSAYAIWNNMFTSRGGMGIQ